MIYFGYRVIELSISKYDYKKFHQHIYADEKKLYADYPFI